MVKIKLKIAIVQLNPQINQIANTENRAIKLLNKLKVHNLTPQLIIFPEFGLTGYNFHSKAQIEPYTTFNNKGYNYDFAKKVSNEFQCYTILGYPEKFISKETKKLSLYNSTMVINADGKLVHNYRKSFLYDTDEEWGCEENPIGFNKFELEFPVSQTTAGASANRNKVKVPSAIGICMDLNPYKFEAPFNDFEFSSFVLDNKVKLIICPMAWLNSLSVTKREQASDIAIKEKLHEITKLKKEMPFLCKPSENDKYSINLDNSSTTPRKESCENTEGPAFRDLNKPDMENVNYWILRFTPLLNINYRAKWWKQLKDIFVERGSNNEISSSILGVTKEKPWGFQDSNAILCMSNRCGIEEDNTVFAGSSGIYKFNGKDFTNEESTPLTLDSSNPSVELLGNLGKGEEGILYREVELEL
ncbi:amidase SCDLUD_000425 [Saccharomycodes ludwigii]|uniref:amidase n=1 Tax=Saccharomycodes ludwigii TaxID=36035 RepID=UPI001E88CA32|nr:hypothetical protein SCDLUD_000425 [Saccharomycodes ludwigii]KAH3902833.1 hypothetical protein SCDLUD_000425 [Saccharomycodes ludwigii]